MSLSVSPPWWERLGAAHGPAAEAEVQLLRRVSPRARGDSGAAVPMGASRSMPQLLGRRPEGPHGIDRPQPELTCSVRKTKNKGVGWRFGARAPLDVCVTYDASAVRALQR